MERYVIIVAGGAGTRMNSAVPKQFMELCGKPVLYHSIQKFIDAFPDIHLVLVIPAALKTEWGTISKKANFNISLQIAIGGETRFHSVKNGLALVPEGCVVGIHDAARPLVSIETIRNTFKTAEEKGNASPCVPQTESIREVKDGKNRSVDRNNYFIIQTPQCFHSTLLKKAFQQNYIPAFTDDASVLEAAGEKINLVTGNRENIKITTAEDMIVAEAYMKNGRN